jgi:hypothetical protein
MEDKRTSFLMCLYKGGDEPNNLEIIPVFPGANDDTVKPPIPDKIVVARHKLRAVLFPLPATGIPPLILGPPIMDTKELGRSPSFQMLGRGTQHQSHASHTYQF